MWKYSENSIPVSNITENPMTKCYLTNDITIKRLESKSFCNKLEGKTLEWCCPVEFPMLEMLVLSVMTAISNVTICTWYVAVQRRNWILCLI